ncbi:hypothetical protein RhiJN_21900 [Ceratobasidium sp. AG-Ba]|nr:hypothetical protein RhiJN_21900 [Ceratobasidium sp. AG-Ba]
MFLRKFSQQRLRGSRGFTQRTRREIKPLPSRVQHLGDEEDVSMRDDLPENYTDWRWMYRISSNWSRGRCFVVTQRVGHPTMSGPLVSGASSARTTTQPECQQTTSDSRLTSHLLLVGDLTIYASHKPSEVATVHIFRDSIASGLSISYSPQSTSRVSVTALSLDHSSADLRLAIFYSDGTWAIYRVDYEDGTSTLLYRQPVAINLLSQNVIQAAYHHPLLVTLTTSFRMSIFYLPTAPSPPVLKHTLSSYSTFYPLTITLSRYRTPDQYRVLLAHASPIYPAHWAPSAIDMMLSVTPIHGSPDLANVKIISSASTNNSVPLGWIPDGTPDGVPEELRLRWARKVSHVSGIQTDGKFVVFASEDGGIQVGQSLHCFPSST